MSDLAYTKFTCSKGDINEIITFLDGGEKQRIDFNKVYMEPIELRDRSRDSVCYHKINKDDFYDKQRTELEKYDQTESKRLNNLYGADNWYDWRWLNWGTKWNAQHISIEDGCVKFATAWDAPRPVFLKLSELFPEHVLEILCDDGRDCIRREIITLKDGDVIAYEDTFPLSNKDTLSDDQSDLATNKGMIIWGSEEKFIPFPLGHTKNERLKAFLGAMIYQPSKNKTYNPC